MVDPLNITDFSRGPKALFEFAAFALCVAGKTAATVAPRVSALLDEIGGKAGVLRTPEPELARALKRHGLGCYTLRARGLKALARLDLRSCTLEQLESVPGVGQKTSRFFVLHSRPGVRRAVLDTHVLKWLREQGVEGVPAATPTGRRYAALEAEFLNRVPPGVTPADFDLEVWAGYARRKETNGNQKTIIGSGDG